MNNGQMSGRQNPTPPDRKNNDRKPTHTLIIKMNRWRFLSHFSSTYEKHCLIVSCLLWPCFKRRSNNAPFIRRGDSKRERKRRKKKSNREILESGQKKMKKWTSVNQWVKRERVRRPTTHGKITRHPLGRSYRRRSSWEVNKCLELCVWRAVWRAVWWGCQ